MVITRRGLALMARALQRSTAPTAGAARWASPLQQQQVRLMGSFEPPRAADKHKPKKKKKKSATKKEPMPSFAIAAAFEGQEELAENVETTGFGDDDILQDIYDDDDAEGDDAVDDRERELKEQFDRGVEKKKLWMQSLAEQRAFATVLKTVADCYAPLYAAMGREGLCPLLGIAQKAAKSVDDLETPYQPQRFDDTLTKMTEQEALALLVMAKQTQLSIAIVEHRMQLGDELAKRSERGEGVVLPGQDVMADEQAVTLGTHFRTFYSFAMSAYSLAGKAFNDELFAIFERVQKAGVYPTSNMNGTYVSALISEQRFEEVFEYFDLVMRESRPVSVFFYRQLVFAVSVARNSHELQRVLNDMRLKGFKLRTEEYLHAIRTFDEDYFLSEKPRSQGKRDMYKKSMQSSKSAGSQFTTPTDNYIACVDRLRDQEEHPERYEKLLGASQSVLELFDEMVHVDGLSPHFGQFYPRVITAAVFTGEFERVPGFLALQAEHAPEGEPLHYAAVRMGINAFLLLDRPMEALELLYKTYPKPQAWQLTHLANILDYLSMHNRGADIIAIVHDAKERGVLAVFTNRVLKKVTPALCRSVDSVSDDGLAELLTQYDDVFGVRTNGFALKLFLRECAYSGRMGAVWSALRERDPSMSGGSPLNGKLGVLLLDKIEDDTDPMLVAMLIEAIDLKTVRRDEQRETILAACERTFEALDQPKTTVRIRKFLDRQQRASTNLLAPASG